MPDPNEPIMDAPIQGGDEPVYRQRGNYDERMLRERDDAAAYLPEIVQPGGDTIVTRQSGLQHTVGGVLQADRPLEAGVHTIVSDRPAPLPTRPAAAPPVVDVVPSDDGGADPRSPGGGPQVISASDLPVIKKAPVVPVVLPTPEIRRVKAKAGPKAKKG